MKKSQELTLLEVEKGKRYRVIGVAMPQNNKEEKSFLWPFYLFGLKKGAELKCLGRGLFKGPLLLEINKRRISVPPKEASSIRVALIK